MHARTHIRTYTVGYWGVEWSLLLQFYCHQFNTTGTSQRRNTLTRRRTVTNFSCQVWPPSHVDNLTINKYMMRNWVYPVRKRTCSGQCESNITLVLTCSLWRFQQKLKKNCTIIANFSLFTGPRTDMQQHLVARYWYGNVTVITVYKTKHQRQSKNSHNFIEM